MPSYKNSSSTVITVGSIRVEPGETVSTNTFIITLPSGLTQETVVPVFDPIIQSTKVTSTQTISIPSNLVGNYKIKIYVTAGEVSIKYNDTSSVSLLLGIGMIEERLCLNRIIE